MEENANTHAKTFSIPLGLIITLLGVVTIAVSIYFPWWERLDNMVGPLHIIHLYKSAMKNPFKFEEYVWTVRDPTLRKAMLYPFILMATSFIFSIISLILLKKSKTIIRGVITLISGAASATSFFVFQHLFEGYMKKIGETVSGSIGYLHWGYGLGCKLSLAAAALMITAWALNLLKTERFEIDLVFEKETEDT
jgi:uncharacterized membrane protein